jgi:hypothetical protein
MRPNSPSWSKRCVIALPHHAAKKNKSIATENGFKVF